MSKVTVVTSWGPKGWDEYAWKFVESFRQFWPKDVQLLTYWEGDKPDAGLEGFDLLETEPCRSFLNRTEFDLVAHGKVLNEPWRWAEKWQRAGYNFKFDAYKFARKVFVMHHAAQTVGSGRLLWIDADVVTKETPPRSLFEELLPDEIGVCLLARMGWYPECGFVGLNLDKEETWFLLETLEETYSGGGYREYQEWHDSYLIGKLVSSLGVNMKPIPHKSRGQPFDFSILGKYMCHYKGARKSEIGLKPERTE